MRTPPAGLRPIGIAQAVGISVFAGLLLSHLPTRENEKTSAIIGRVLLSPLISWLMASIAHHFMEARLMASPRRWYSPGEIARALGVDRRSVTRWIRQGKLEADRPHPNKRYAKVTPAQLAEAARRGTIPALTVGWMRRIASES